MAVLVIFFSIGNSCGLHFLNEKTYGYSTCSQSNSIKSLYQNSVFGVYVLNLFSFFLVR